MSASCAAGWGAYLYPFYSQMAKVELEEVFSEVPLAITESLVHLQDRLCGMSYGSRHETSNLRTFVVGRGARGSDRRAALQRRLCSAPKPDTSGKFSWRVPAQDRCEFGMWLPDGAQRHPRFQQARPGCSGAGLLAPEAHPRCLRRGERRAVAGDAPPLSEGVRQGDEPVDA